jgi:hypothetical protein
MVIDQQVKTQPYLTDYEFITLLPLVEDYYDKAFLLSVEDYIQRFFEFSGKLPTLNQIYDYVPKFIIAIEEEDRRIQYKNLGM